MTMETIPIKVLSLNCWGIVALSKERKARMSAIATHLASSNYDFVFLQEVWSERDFKMICSKTESVLPHSFFFYNGAIGSGMCILSKSAILDTCFCPYSLSGYAHRIDQGDWYCGKGVGFCNTFYKGLNISLFVTHLHAEYNNQNDPYLGHRIVQAFEFSQFVKITSVNSDVVLLAGDFNTEPEDVAYDLIRSNVGCLDAFPDQTPFTGTVGTCCLPGNIYTPNQFRKQCPNGQRIDYILYKSNSGTSIQCLSYENPLSTIPENDAIPYSDHEAVVATFQASKSTEAKGTPSSVSALASCLKEANYILKNSLASQQKDCLFYIFASVTILCLLFATLPFELPRPYSALVIFLHCILSFILAYTVWMAAIVNRTEGRAIEGASVGISHLSKKISKDLKNDSQDVNI